MSGKQGLALGLLCGIAVGAIAFVATMVWAGGQLNDARQEAYERGIQDANAAAGNAEPIALQLNAAMMKENEELHAALKAAREKLEPLPARTDLPAEAKTAIEEALKDLR